ncbi:MAG: hypothetical protein U5Q03_00505 [Bacteroidota bacterium]|nr:hypothetical protein [Bacteroidota bacterium]
MENSSTGRKWPQDYKRSLSPEHFVFPSKGYLYESLTDQEVEYITAWHVPFTGHAKSRLYKREKIWIAFDVNEEEPLKVDALPVEYLKLEARMVPLHERNDPGYRGFYFRLGIKTLNKKFKLLQKDFSKDMLG